MSTPINLENCNDLDSLKSLATGLNLKCDNWGRKYFVYQRNKEHFSLDSLIEKIEIVRKKTPFSIFKSTRILNIIKEKYQATSTITPTVGGLIKIFVSIQIIFDHFRSGFRAMNRLHTALNKEETRLNECLKHYMAPNIDPALLYTTGMNMSNRDRAQALEILKQAAKRGSRDAVIKLASLTKNDTTYYMFIQSALHKLANEKNDREAQLLLSDEKSNLRPEDRNSYLELAVRAKYPKALCVKGLKKIGDRDKTPQDFKEGLNILTEAADLGYAEAQYQIGIIHTSYFSPFLELDFKTGLRYLEMAMDQKYLEACDFLAHLYRFDPTVKQSNMKTTDYEPKRIFRDLQSAVDLSGSAATKIALAHCYRLGVGVEINTTKAFALYSEASKESALGLNEVGNCYFNGIGVAQDKKEAATHYYATVLVDPKNGFAHYRLGICYEKGLGREVSLGKAYSHYFKAESRSDYPTHKKASEAHDRVKMVRDRREQQKIHRFQVIG